MTEQITVKHCKHCADMGREAVHPISDFASNKAMQDGLSFYCKVCDRERVARYRMTNRDAINRRRHIAALSPEQLQHKREKDLAGYHRTKEMHRDAAKARAARQYRRKCVLMTLLTWTLQSPNRLQMFTALNDAFNKAVYTH